jgi:DNA-binding CsgD family transcriptional regulator
LLLLINLVTLIQRSLRTLTYPLPLFDLSAQIAGPDPLQRDLEALCAALGFDYAAYAGVSTLDKSLHAVVTYPVAWKQHYLAHNLHLQDPTLRYAIRSHAPVQWSRLCGDVGFDPVFSQARDFGIGTTGLTIPVRGRFGDMGLLSVTRSGSQEEWHKHCETVLERLQQRAALLHDAVMRRIAPHHDAAKPALSTREIEVLQWIAAGKNQSDVADILTISSRTVEVHLRSARHKLNALTTPQAVARAVGLGMIYPL